MAIVAMLVIAAYSVAAAVTAATAAPPQGVPAGRSLLFAVDGKNGTFTRPHRTQRPNRYTLTLGGLHATTIWFTDRPHRDAGRIDTAELFSHWGRFGFRADPPNAVVIAKGRSGRHSVAVELRLRAYDPRSRTAHFDVRVLGSLGGGLRHLGRSLDGRLPPRFGALSLFIDDAGEWDSSCVLGQPQLMAVPPGTPLESMVPADGRTLPVAGNRALFELYGTRFGGDGSSDFAIPDMRAAAPAGAAWYVCDQGQMPTPRGLGESGLGEIDYWILPFPPTVPGYLPADGRTVTSEQYPAYSEAFAGSAPTFTLPDIAAPPGMTALVSVERGLAPAWLGEVDLFPGLPVAPPRWEPARGQTLRQKVGEAGGLGPLLGDLQGLEEPKVPDLSGPVAGTGYYIAAEGEWPLR